MINWERVADLATDAVPRVVHGGLVAVNHVVAAFTSARSARESEQTGELQTVLALMAWAGAVRVRVAGAHVLYRMDAMPASLKVPSHIYVRRPGRSVSISSWRVRQDPLGQLHICCH